MKTVPLGEVAEFVRGVTFKPTDKTNDGSGVPVMRTKNVQAQLDLSDMIRIPVSVVGNNEKYLRCGDTLVSSANSWNLVGKCCWVSNLPEPMVIGGFVAALRARSDELNPRYLYHWFSSRRIQALVRSFGNQTTNISNLSVPRCLKMKLPLPSVEEQRRIAAILDKADSIRVKRRQVLDHLDAITQSVFHDMFGDPTQTNETISFGDVAELSGGRNLVAEDQNGDSRYRVLKISAVTTGTFDPSQSKPLPEGYEPPASHLLRQGDLLMSRANTAELVGATALVDAPVENIALPDKVWRFSWKILGSSPVFYNALLQTREIRAVISRLSSGTGGSMKNISNKKLYAMQLPTVSLSRQRNFEKRVSSVHAVRRRAVASAQHLDELFASLQSRAFTGEL